MTLSFPRESCGKLAIPADRQIPRALAPISTTRSSRCMPAFSCARYSADTWKDIYGSEVSPDLISSAATDAVLEEVAEWQIGGRWMWSYIYPLIFFDAIRVIIRDEGLCEEQGRLHSARHPVPGHEEILGIWMSRRKAAKFWLMS